MGFKLGDVVEIVRPTRTLSTIDAEVYDIWEGYRAEISPEVNPALLSSIGSQFDTRLVRLTAIGERPDGSEQTFFYWEENDLRLVERDTEEE